MAKFSGKRIYQAKVDRLFNVIVSSSLKEFNKSLDMPDEEIINAKITKPYQNRKESKEAKIQVINFVRDKVYTVTTVVDSLIYNVELKFEPKDDNTSQITYTEHIISVSKFRNMSYQFFGFFIKGKMKKKIQRMLKQLESKL